MARSRHKVTPIITAGAYAANDVIGSRLQFPAVRQGMLEQVMIADRGAQNVAYRLVLMESQPTAISDNQPINIAGADLDKILHILSLPTSHRTAFISNSVTVLNSLEAPLQSIDSGGSIYGFLYTTGAPTYATASDITVVLTVRPPPGQP